MAYARKFCTQNSLKIITDQVLSVENRLRTVEYLKKLKPISTGKMISKRRAAVLVPLCQTNGELSLLFTIRGRKLRNNSGQVAFPGGMEDLDDKSLKETVLRETFEEVGIAAETVDMWGEGPLVGRNEMTVTPFLGDIGVISLSQLKINPEEVERVFATPLATFCNNQNFGTTEFRGNNSRYVLPVFTTSEFKMWGLTALITHTMLTALIPQHYRHQIPRQVMTSTNLPKIVFAACFLIPQSIYF